MGLFDNPLTSGFLGSTNATKKAGNDKVWDQQAGCAMKHYSNNDLGTGTFFWEIQSCNVDRTIGDVGGSFTVMLNSAENLDEVLLPGDYVRIFMGDEIASAGALSKGAYNVSEANLAQGLLGADILASGSTVYVPVPGQGPLAEGGKVKPGQQKSVNYLVMFERMLGKIDRVERIHSTPAQDAGTTVQFAISGRSFGCIIQDATLYYNPFIPGLNALNVFYGAGTKVFARPDEAVKDAITLVLSSVPMPQFNLPDSLVQDLNSPELLSQVTLALEATKGFISRLQSSFGKNPSNATDVSFIKKLTALAQNLSNLPTNTPIRFLSLNFAKTTGRLINKIALNSTTTSLYDLCKYLSNDVFNEFYFDMCPSGKASGSGRPKDARVLPTLVMRQRPLDVTNTMLTKIANYIKPFAKNIVSLFPASQIPGTSKSLEDLMDTAITIYGPMQQKEPYGSPTGSPLDAAISAAASAGATPTSRIFTPVEKYRPNLIQYQVGMSDHMRFNGFLCIGAHQNAQSRQTDRVLAADGGYWNGDVESIKKYGTRMFEVSTAAIQPDEQADQSLLGSLGISLSSPEGLIKQFSKILANWYYMNPAFLNGRIVSRFLPDARLGIPCQYFETRVTTANPYPKMELFYVEGVTDSYSYGAPITTTLTVTRGMRYNLGSSGGLDLANTVRERVSGFIKGLV